MSNKIFVLPEALAQKIAAGEVVERPSSCVKELVENSIDAGATIITVEVHDGGKSLIRVTDNGGGMNKDDAVLSLSRHATSKIKNEDDLFAIHTMGFRGEALPSMAAVSKLTLLTKDENSEGTKIVCAGGEIKSTEAAGCPKGTLVSIADLFFNTPARNKFLKSTATEFARITDVVTLFALSFPHITFKLFHGGNNVFSFPACSFHERLFQVFGKKKAEMFTFVHYENGNITFEGCISLPHAHRGNRSEQFFFVNRRAVKSPVLAKSFGEAYADFIPKERFPACVLFLTVPPHDVDVNVHPAKLEVRFQNSSAVFEAVKNTVHETLSREKTLAPVEKTLTVDTQNVFLHDASSSYIHPEIINPVPCTLHPAPSVQISQPSLVSTEFRVIGQALKMFMLAEKGDEIFLVDQHALHERVLYNQLKKQFEENEHPSQPLLLPQTFELNAKESALLHEHMPVFEKLGFEFEAFGGNTFLLRRAPQFLINFSEQKLSELLEQLFDFPSMLKKHVLVEEKMLATAACKLAVKAGDALSQEEMKGLFSVLESAEFVPPSLFSCAHGRPTVIRLQKKDLERQFGRT